ncbi:hypothetical protein V7S43_002350 [Phytophthora oleae]|uniref:Uncharacterized protein n=1 Tax=Phytophthora oleae TaxID=2107226 RepID=A0ABD3G4X4_9STRA
MSDPEICASIRIQARLLFTAAESIRGLHFLRLYLGEQNAPEPLDEQQKEYQEAQRDDPFQANQFLITLSLYKVAADDPNLPTLGSAIAFTPTKLRLYRNCCEVDAKLQDIVTVAPP